jgi:hypothetical protein
MAPTPALLLEDKQLVTKSARACERNAAIVSATRSLIARNRRRLNRAWALSGGSNETPPFTGLSLTAKDGPAVGVCFGRLTEVHPDRIVVANRTVYLSACMKCRHASGIYVQVVYRVDASDRYELVSLKGTARADG